MGVLPGQEGMQTWGSENKVVDQLREQGLCKPLIPAPTEATEHLRHDLLGIEGKFTTVEVEVTSAGAASARGYNQQWAQGPQRLSPHLGQRRRVGSG